MLFFCFCIVLIIYLVAGSLLLLGVVSTLLEEDSKRERSQRKRVRR